MPLIAIESVQNYIGAMYNKYSNILWYSASPNPPLEPTGGQIVGATVGIVIAVLVFYTAAIVCVIILFIRVYKKRFKWIMFLGLVFALI